MLLRRAVLADYLDAYACPVEARGCYTRPMCGRYTHRHTWPEIVALYRLTQPAVAPTSPR